MMKINKIFITLSFFLPIFIACDTDLFKADDKGQDPVAGEILTESIDTEINVGDTVRFSINATDPDGGTLAYLWNKTAGEFVSTPDKETVLWRAPLKGGDYTLRVTVSNKDKSISRSKIVRVISFEKPVVNILSPAAGSFLVQYESYILITEAYHDNGISSVRMYVNDIFAGIGTEVQPSIFQLAWKATGITGKVEIKAVAEAVLTAAVDMDSIMCSIEGVIPGKQ